MSVALCVNLQKSHGIIPPYLLLLFSNKLLKCITRNQGDKSLSLDADILDEFTTQLMQRKSNKWEIMRVRRKLDGEQQFNCTLKPKSKERIAYLDVVELDTVLNDAVENGNDLHIKGIINECIEFKMLPTLPVLLRVLSFYSQNGDKDTVLSVIALCSEMQLDCLEEMSHFQHYLAEATWVKGNVNEAITLFEDTYRSNVYLRRKIRLILKNLITDTVSNRSEAVLHNMIGFAKRLLDDFKDFYPLTCIWQACFLSNWFTDQCIALDLLKDTNGLYKALSIRMPYLVTLALKNHQTEVVYRLLELLLRFEQKSQYSRILEALFDYRVRQGDLRGCSEIIQWSLKQDIVLPSIQQEKFINLLISQTSDPSSINTEMRKSKLPVAPELHFKF